MAGQVYILISLDTIMKCLHPSSVMLNSIPFNNWHIEGTHLSLERMQVISWTRNVSSWYSNHFRNNDKSQLKINKWTNHNHQTTAHGDGPSAWVQQQQQLIFGDQVSLLLQTLWETLNAHNKGHESETASQPFYFRKAAMKSGVSGSNDPRKKKTLNPGGTEVTLVLKQITFRAISLSVSNFQC